MSSDMMTIMLGRSAAEQVCGALSDVPTRHKVAIANRHANRERCFITSVVLVSRRAELSSCFTQWRQWSRPSSREKRRPPCATGSPSVRIPAVADSGRALAKPVAHLNAQTGVCRLPDVIVVQKTGDRSFLQSPVAGSYQSAGLALWLPVKRRYGCETFPVNAVEKFVGFDVSASEFFGVPVDWFSGAKRDVSKQDGVSQSRSVVEV